MTSLCQKEHKHQEYMIPRGSHSFCLYDTRGLSDDSTENKKLLERWLTRGVRHGELVQRASDDVNLISLESKHRQNTHISGGIRTVKFVIVVVNGISVLESLDSDDEGKKQYTQIIATIFTYPFLSFKDDLPVIDVSHGDLLSLTDRVRIRVHLENLFGVPLKNQIFDIPNNNSKATELAIVDLLSHCLDRGDRNLPLKKHKLSLFMEQMFMLLPFGPPSVPVPAPIPSGLKKRWDPASSDVGINWHEIQSSTCGLHLAHLVPSFDDSNN